MAISQKRVPAIEGKHMMNMIMEKNFTCLYYKNEAYLDRVYVQQINDIYFEI